MTRDAGPPDSDVATTPRLAQLTWGPALVAQVAPLLAKGLSYREIGDAIGCSRQAVVSGIARHAPELRRNTPQARRRVARVVDGPAARLWLAAALVARPPGGCAWPLGDTADRRFAFCGCPVGARPPEERRGFYCDAHLAVAYLRDGETQADRDSGTGVEF